MIKQFVSDVCNLLDIPVPAVSFDVSNFSSNTMMAQADPDGTMIFIKDTPDTPDLFFAVAHELRHIWQSKHNKELYFCCYKTVNQCKSLEEYNLQIAEIDANAFAGLVMSDFFGLQPLFQGVPDTVKNRIFEQMEYLQSSL